MITVTSEQIQAGLIKYIDTEIAAKATGLTKFMVYFTAPSIPNMVMAKISEYKTDPLFADMFDENGNVKLDNVYKRAKNAISKSGRVLIPKINYFIDETDVETICNLIKNS